ACSSYYKKGSTVCANKLLTPLASAENAVLACVEADVLRLGVVNAVLQRVIDHYTMPAPTDDAKRASVSREIAKAEAEQQRLLKVVREGASDVTALAVALRAGQ